jgi:hypothetical protein
MVTLFRRILVPCQQTSNFDLSCDFYRVCRAGDDDSGGGEDLQVAEPQLQGGLHELDQLRQRVQDGGLPRRQVQDALPREQVLLHKGLLTG